MTESTIAGIIILKIEHFKIYKTDEIGDKYDKLSEADNNLHFVRTQIKLSSVKIHLV